MSFTLWYTKPDGTKKPIKMSIWDAMKGVPDPNPRKPKPKPCLCCGKSHVKDKPNEDSKCDEKKEANDNDKDNRNKGNDDTKGKSKNEDSDLTEDDRTMLRMKSENHQAQWKDILAVTTSFKNVGELKARWRQINHRLEAGNKDNFNGSKKKDRDAEREERTRRDREEGLKRKAEREAARARKGEEEKKAEEQREDGTRSDKKDDDNKSATWDGNAKKSSPSPNSLKAWADNYDKKKWQIMASKHYDKTGERITASQARKLAGAK
ncbi:uncharacterized protein Z519_08046 [Cladophialophora bantiana CBS 173.52]|uniref:Myb-like domain-containing protein n=1 Tax=Cladophialophora bantiana (strain ATCC 10958 / CBS 173.52 / CDC B-1940 / NIH 8579) TaxID=1442370 RepID=A0A0D2EMA5_CLAB1|nr:uncharacterized protein Z519_08046 [Cladophialophora bantiana CBS 173.52]KIW91151.1 hypothetical protein Z519_08046 [Cladophialophora bantiana CBS 173.52]